MITAVRQEKRYVTEKNGAGGAKEAGFVIFDPRAVGVCADGADESFCAGGGALGGIFQGVFEWFQYRLQSGRDLLDGQRVRPLLAPGRISKMERIVHRLKMMRRLIVPVVLYLLLTNLVFLKVTFVSETLWRYGCILLSLAPGIVLVIGLADFIHRLDELEQKVLLNGIGLSFGLTLLVLFTLGILEFAGLGHVNSLYVALFMIVIWGVGKLISMRRYQ